MRQIVLDTETTGLSPPRDEILDIGILAGSTIPKTALQWLSRYPEVFNLWLFTLSGRYTEAGMLGEICSKADQHATVKSPSQNIGNQRLQPEAESEPQSLFHLWQHHGEQRRSKLDRSFSSGCASKSLTTTLESTLIMRICIQ